MTHRIAAILVLAVVAVAAVGCGPAAPIPVVDQVTLLITADGDGHLQGLPLQIGGGYPVGGLGRLELAVGIESGYVDEVTVLSAGGDIGEFPDATLAEMIVAADRIGYQAVGIGSSELARCELLSNLDHDFTVMSANVTHDMVQADLVSITDGIAVTTVTDPELGDLCEGAAISDPAAAIADLAAANPEVEHFVVLSYMGAKNLELVRVLAASDSRVSAVVSSGARVDAGTLPMEVQGGPPMILIDAGREWRSLLSLRLGFDDKQLVSYEGTRRVVLTDQDLP